MDISIIARLTIKENGVGTIIGSMNGPRHFDLIIFDMDGTLTIDALNFQDLRQRLGIELREPVLEWIAELPPEKQAAAWDALHQFEHEGALASELRAGAKPALYRLQSLGIRTALLSRNSRRSVETILGRHSLDFDHIASRDDLPMKPHPESIWRITRRLGVELHRVLMVGDYIFDIQAAQAAGVRCVLLLEPGTPPPHFAADADFHIQSLEDMVALAEEPDRYAVRVKRAS